ncbi:hypothetical protein WD019_06935 [Fictibacillus sp. Mic-4]|uniref:hypothetical protein n=1 Tax=Fictibacillus sp. Mic-4 TaxID=3132826 RepID=UPI003CF0D9F1
MDVAIYPIFEESEPLEEMNRRPHMSKRGALTWFFGRGDELNVLLVGLGKAKTFRSTDCVKPQGVPGGLLK